MKTNPKFIDLTSNSHNFLFDYQNSYYYTFWKSSKREWRYCKWLKQFNSHFEAQKGHFGTILATFLQLVREIAIE